MNPNDIIKKAKARAKKYEILKRDPRTQKVLGKFKHEGWLIAPHIRANHCRIFLKDALWVGELIEPRVLELLPAIIIKCPKTFYNTDLPDDLNTVIRNLKKGNLDDKFRGIPLRDCYQWIKRIGQTGKYPSVLKTYRFSKEDLELLKSLAQKRQSSEIQVIRDALRKLI